jgi:hypothetical protein
MAYSNRWNSTDQVPLRAITSGQLGLFDAFDPTDGGNAARYSLSGQWAQSDANGTTRANFYAIRSTLDLFNNFTYFLGDQTNGDQFHQHDGRTLGGVNASHTIRGSVAGLATETTFGFQSRYDDIVEWSNDYRPLSWIRLETSLALTNARFVGYDTEQAALFASLAGYPQALIGNAPGNYVPGAPAAIASATLTLGDKLGWFGALGLRYFGPRPLTEDNAFRSPPTALLNGRVGYRFDNGWRIQLDAFNLTNSRSDQISYAYGSFLKTDTLYNLCFPASGTSTVPAAVCQNGVMDRVLHPVEPLAIRLTLAGAF